MTTSQQSDLQHAGQVLAALLKASVEANCSDIHLRAGKPPFGRVGGNLVQMQGSVITQKEIDNMIQVITGHPIPTGRTSAFEFSFEQRGIARFRGHAFRAGGVWALALRSVPLQIPSFNELNLPVIFQELAQVQPGLVLVAGPTGSGKSTTVAALLQKLAAESTLHVVTIEDPIEYKLGDVPSCVTQREVGADTPSYEEALRSALREDPDILFLGEIRDSHSLEVVMNAAETGHMVVSTFHTTNAVQTIQRLVSMFATEDHDNIRDRLADSLRAIVCQRLIPSKDGGTEQILVSESLFNNYATKECIRDRSRLRGLIQVLERSQDQYMHTFDQDLLRLVKEGRVNVDQAAAMSSSAANFRRALTMGGKR